MSLTRSAASGSDLFWINSMKILAIDPGNNCGYCWLGGTKRRYGCWALVRKDEHEGGRLLRLREYMHKAADAWGIDRIAYEESSLGAGGRKHGIQWPTVVLHNQLRGIVLLVAAEIGAEALPVNPMTLKKWATGNGRAKKPDMIRAAATHYGVETEDDNVADAVLLAGFARQNLPGAAKRKRKRQTSRRSDKRWLF